MPERPQPTLAEIAQQYGLLGQPPYVSALAQQRALADQDDACRPCDLCASLTPRSLLRPEAFQEWDALCPACWRLASAHTALELAREETHMIETCPRCDAPPSWHQASRHLPYEHGEIVAVVVWQLGTNERPVLFHPRQTGPGYWYALDGPPDANALLPMEDAPLWRLRTPEDTP